LPLFPDPRRLPAEALLRALDHVLAGQPWLRDRLVPHAGRLCRVEVFPVALRLRIGPDGSLVADREAVAPDAEIRLSPLALARLLGGDEGARTDVQLSGDPALAAALAGVFQELRWDVEEDLSRVVGDIPARRLVDGARRLAAWQAGALQGLAASVSEYLQEERPVLARRDELARWSQEVDALRDAVERMEKRIERATATRMHQD
jgi:ubiquinone biosynthesis protein UbiJ